jgi:hypothetical protein
MLRANDCYIIFQQSIDDYHAHDDINSVVKNPYPEGSFNSLLYSKNWIDTIQWHLEDIIRSPSIDPVEALKVKRRIDKSNQDRTDMVERLDDHFFEYFKNVKPIAGTRINSETPAWLLDRMSILMLKIYHMKEQTERSDVSQDHLKATNTKLGTLLEQKSDMQIAYDELLEDISSGKRRFKIYRQMKMYNDPSLNPVLYGSGSNS